MTDNLSGVFIAGVGRTPFGRFLDKPLRWLVREAVDACLVDAGASREQVEQVFFANTAQGALEGQHMIRGQVALRAMGLEGVPIANVENACASASTAFKLAVTSIRSGEADVVLVVGADKLTSELPEAASQFFTGAMDVAAAEATLAKLTLVAGEPGQAAARRSVFMDIYAAVGRRYLDRHGASQAQLAAVTSKNRAHAAHNPNAQFTSPLTVDEVLAARTIVWPLTLPMCAPMGDGSAAALVCSARGIARLAAGRRAVRVRAAVLGTGSTRDFDDNRQHVTRRLAQQAYELAGVDPRDVSCAEVHDATAVGEVIQTECLGLCALGQGAADAERGATRLGGRVPVNLSGGLECNGHPVGATGLAQIHELVLQLRGEAGARQTPAPRLAVAENGGGWIDVEEAVATVTLLERPAI